MGSGSPLIKCHTGSFSTSSGIPSTHSHTAGSSGQWDSFSTLPHCLGVVGSGCGVVWCGVVWCGVVWCGVVWCGVVWCGVVWCGVVWCGVVWCGVVWCAVMCYVAVRCGVECGVRWSGARAGHECRTSESHTHTHTRARVENCKTRTKQEKRLKEISSGTAELS